MFFPISFDLPSGADWNYRNEKQLPVDNRIVMFYYLYSSYLQNSI